MRSKKKKNKESGMATVEAISMLIIFSVMASYSLGTFGIVHSGIVNSIVARAYAFETFRQRSNLVYWRDDRPGSNTEYSQTGFRFHGVTSEESNDKYWRATGRSLAIGREGNDVAQRDEAVHNGLDLLAKVERVGVNPVWIKTVYGICLNSSCGRQGP